MNACSPHRVMVSYVGRRVRSVKEETLSPLILFGKRSLRRALAEYVTA